MHFLNLIKRNKLAVIFVILLAVILGVGSIIYFMDYSNKNPNLSSGSDLKNYAELKTKINPLLSLSDIPPEVLLRITKYLNILNDNKSSKEERYNAAVKAYEYLYTSYTLTSNNKFAPVLKDFSVFAKNNFPDFYKNSDFIFFCKDPSCAEEPQPPAILAIIDDINASDFPDDVKKQVTRNLLTTGYLPSERVKQKFNQYLFIETSLRTYGIFSKNGDNLRIAESLLNFIEKEYPEELKGIQQRTASESGITK